MSFSTIAVPQGRVLRKLPKEGQPPGLRRMASTSTPPKRDFFDLGPRSDSRNSLNFDRQPQSPTFSGFVWPFHKSGSLVTTKSSLTERSSNSLQEGAPKFRVVGRGGSGSKLRQVSITNPVAVLEPDAPSLHQPVEPEPPFYRPTGRGGLGSLSTSPPKALKPLKPPTAILYMLRGRKRSEVQLIEQYQLHRTSPPRRPQSLYYRSDQIQKDIYTISDADYIDDSFSPSKTSRLRGPSASISHNIHHPDHNKDTDSYIEEEIYWTPNEHRERSLNKLARTLGALPPPLMECPSKTPIPNKRSLNKLTRTLGDLPPSLMDGLSNEHRERSLNKLTRTLGAIPPFLMEGPPSKSPIFDNFSTEDNFIEPRLHHTKWDSFESESDTLSSGSPITFAPLSDENIPNFEQTPTPLNEIDSSFTTTSPTRDSEDHSAQSHSPPEPSSSPMPHLYVSTHSDALSDPNDVPPDPNLPVATSDWLVPLDEVVISIRRTAPSKPQSWTGEWNREMKDVIRDLRRL